MKAGRHRKDDLPASLWPDPVSEVERHDIPQGIETDPGAAACRGRCGAGPARGWSLKSADSTPGCTQVQFEPGA